MAMKPNTKDPLKGIVGKTIKKVDFTESGPQITLTFTDETTFSLISLNRPCFNMHYYYGPADDEFLEKEIKGSVCL